MPFENFNELDDANFIMRLANTSDVKIIIGDSYRITRKWVERLKKRWSKGCSFR